MERQRDRQGRRPAAPSGLLRRAALVALCAAVAFFAALGFASLGPRTARAAGAWPGSGSAEDPYVIWSAEDLASLAKDVRNGADYRGKTFKLGCDLDLAGLDGHEFVIGYAGTYDNQGSSFKGVFDGDGHAIRNLAIDVTRLARPFRESNGSRYTLSAGLFGSLGPGAEVRSLTLESCSVTGDTSVNDAVAEGGFNDMVSVGILAGSVYAVGAPVSIVNVNVVDGSVHDPTDAVFSKMAHSYGGLVGYVYSNMGKAGGLSVRNSSVDCDVYTGARTTDDLLSNSGTGNPILSAGGIVGFARATAADALAPAIENCAFHGDVFCRGVVNPFLGACRNSAKGGQNGWDVGARMTLVQNVSSSWYGGGLLATPDKTVPNTRVNVTQGLPATGGRLSNGTVFPDLVDPEGRYTYEQDGAFAPNFNRVAGKGLDFGSFSEVGGAEGAARALGAVAAQNEGWEPWGVYEYEAAGSVVEVPFVGKARVSVREDRPAEGGRRFVAADVTGAGAADKQEVLAGGSWSAVAKDGSAVAFEGRGTGSIALPVFPQDVTVTFSCSLGEASFLLRASTFSTSLTRRPEGAGVALAASIDPGTTGCAAADFRYEWWGTADGESWERIDDESGARRAFPQDAPWKQVKVVAFPVQAPGFRLESAPVSLAGLDVFVDNQNASGAASDANDGTLERPVRTLRRAYQILREADGVPGSMEANHIYLTSTYDASDRTDGGERVRGEFGNAKSADTLDVPATIAGVAVEGDEWRLEPARELQWAEGSMDAGKFLRADTALASLTLKGLGKYGSIYCQGHDLLVDLGVTMSGYMNSAKNQGQNPSDKDMPHFHVYGGFFNYNQADLPGGKGLAQDYTITLRSGTYARVLAGARNNGAVNPVSKNCYGSEESFSRARIVVDYPQGRADGGYDIGSLYGGQTDGSFFGSASIEFTERNQASLYYVVGANLSYVRPGAYNYFTGVLDLDLKSGTVHKFYAGCLGRADSGTAADNHAEFVHSDKIRATLGLPDDRPDISVRLGSRLHVLGSVYGAGAGGWTGSADKPVSLSLVLDGCTVEGNVFGGGGGVSPLVTVAERVSAKAGLFFGSSSVVLNAGVVKGDVYGGGEGTDRYPERRELATLTGSTSVDIRGGAVEGNVYGGGMGFSAEGLEAMAEVRGTASVTMSGGSVAGSVFGGGAFGRVSAGGGEASSAPRTSVRVTGGTVGGSVYGAGRGEAGRAEAGKVDGAASVAIGALDGRPGSEPPAVGGSVYGGGAFGAVCGDSSVSVLWGAVAGSVFGAGQGTDGSVSDAGAVQGSSLATVASGAVAGSVYGGGAFGSVGSSSGVVLTGGSVEGSVFGGGQGRADTPGFGRIPKDATVRASGGSVAGSVFGGGAYGDVGGSCVVTLGGATAVGGSVFGGGRGVDVAGVEVGSVGGVALVRLSGTARVEGSVYGGGAFGPVALSSSVEVGVSRNDKPSVGGSVFGAGQGARGLDKGSVGGSAKVTVRATGEPGVSGSVYGGGELGSVLGTATDAKRGAFSTCVAVEGGHVGGFVFGAGKGVEAEDPQGLVPVRSFVSLAAGVVDQNVYGGGEHGSVGDPSAAEAPSLPVTSVTVAGTASVGGNVYGAGKGSGKEELNTGQVFGRGSVLLEGAPSVGGNVYGGGENGTVGSGTGTAPQLAATTTVTMTGGSVGGNVFGAGEGSSGSSVKGALFGSARVYLYGGRVAANVFGGGNESRVYSGGPENQATLVVVNSTCEDVFVCRSGERDGDSFGKVVDKGFEGAVRLDDIQAKLRTLGLSAVVERSVTVGGSVLGGGNVSDASSAMAGVYTVFGRSDVVVKGAGVSFAGAGGVYGDGYLSLVEGERNVTVTGFRSRAGDALKQFNSVQRADCVTVDDSAFYTFGAADVVDNFDSTRYSVNRVGVMKLYRGSTVQLDTVVSRLCSLWSDVATGFTFTKPGASGAVDLWEGPGRLGEGAEMERYRTAVESQGVWSFQGVDYDRFNTVTLNNGRPLKVADAPDGEDDTHPKDFGVVRGLFTLNLIAPHVNEGGGFVYGSMGESDATVGMTDSTGHFCSINKDGEGRWLAITTRQVDDRRVWYIKGTDYIYRLDLKAVVTGDEASKASVKLWLPVSAHELSGSAPSHEEANKLRFKVDGVQFWNDDERDPADLERDDEGVLDRLRLQDEVGAPEAENLVAVRADFGNEAGNAFGCQFKQPGADGYKVDKRDLSLTVGEGETLVPVTFSLQTSGKMCNDDHDGYIRCVLSTTRGDRFDLRIHVIVERYDAQGIAVSAPGKLYGGVGSNQAGNITDASAWTTEFTTIYSPGTFTDVSGGAEATMSIIPNLRADLNSSNAESNDVKDTANLFPRGTEITLVDLTTAGRPRYYLHRIEAAGGEREVMLTQFRSMTDDGASFALHREMALTRERLVFVVDYENAEWGGALPQSGVAAQYLVLKHTRTVDGRSTDLLHYALKDENDRIVGYYPVPSSRRGVMARAHYERQTRLEFKAAAPEGKPLSQTAWVNPKDNPCLYDVFGYRLVLDLPNDNVTANTNAFHTAHESMPLVLALRFSDDRSVVKMPPGTQVKVRREDGQLADPLPRYAFAPDTAGSFATSTFFATVSEGSYLVEVWVPRTLARGRFLVGENAVIEASVFASPENDFAAVEAVRAGNGTDAVAATFAAPFTPSAELPRSAYEIEMAGADGSSASDHRLEMASGTGVAGYAKLWRTLSENGRNLDGDLGSSAEHLGLLLDDAPTDAIALTRVDGQGVMSAGLGTKDAPWIFRLNASGLAPGPHSVTLLYGGTKETLTLTVAGQGARP